MVKRSVAYAAQSRQTAASAVRRNTVRQDFWFIPFISYHLFMAYYDQVSAYYRSIANVAQNLWLSNNFPAGFPNTDGIANIRQSIASARTTSLQVQALGLQEYRVIVNAGTSQNYNQVWLQGFLEFVREGASQYATVALQQVELYIQAGPNAPDSQARRQEIIGAIQDHLPFIDQFRDPLNLGLPHLYETPSIPQS